MVVSTTAATDQPLLPGVRCQTLYIESASVFAIGDEDGTNGAFTDLSLDQVILPSGKVPHYDLSEIYVNSAAGDDILVVYTEVQSVD